jgi:SAM-dependent methyltransferase
VTPAIVAAFEDLVVIDWSRTARGTVAERDRIRAIDGDWLTLPLLPASCGGALGDGSLSCLAWPSDYARLFDALGRVLRPGAYAVIRCYASPEGEEQPEQIVADAMAGKIAGFAAFKWRLAMALVTDAEPNVPVAAIKDRFDALIPDRDALAAATHWTRAAVDDVDAYGGTVLRYSFPTRRQIVEQVGPAFASAGFVETQDYELAERCPLLVLKRGR